MSPDDEARSKKMTFERRSKPGSQVYNFKDFDQYGPAQKCLCSVLKRHGKELLKTSFPSPSFARNADC